MGLLTVTKMHGLGNNYIYISEFEEHLKESELSDLARAVSDVRRGIGSDGMILIGPSSIADVRMRIFNADGSEAENCGNGLRCVAKYAYEHGYARSEDLTVEYLTGVAKAHVHMANQVVDKVTVDMGQPRFGAEAVGLDLNQVVVKKTGCQTIGSPTSGDGLSELEDSKGMQYFVCHLEAASYRGTLVSMGNPHLVIVSPDARQEPVEAVGPRLERHAAFPNRINVEFVTPLSRGELDFRVWERGSGVTFACGTGACASVAAGIAEGLLDKKVVVHLLGGDLEIELRNGHIFMTGEAKEVMRGQFHWGP